MQPLFRAIWASEVKHPAPATVPPPMYMPRNGLNKLLTINGIQLWAIQIGPFAFDEDDFCKINFSLY